MRTTLIATASVVALLASSAAFAKELPGESAAIQLAQSSGTTGAGGTGGGTGDAGAAADNAGQADGSASDAGAADDSGANKLGGANTEIFGESYKSFTNLGPDFKGEIGGGYDPNDLVGKRVVGPTGERYGEISDLMVDENNTVHYVVTDTNEYLGTQDRFVPLNVEQLERKDGVDVTYSTLATRDELEGFPVYRFEAENGVWVLQKQ